VSGKIGTPTGTIIYIPKRFARRKVKHARGARGSGSDARRTEPGGRTIERSRPARISVVFEPRPQD